MRSIALTRTRFIASAEERDLATWAAHPIRGFAAVNVLAALHLALLKAITASSEFRESDLHQTRSIRRAMAS